MRGVRRRSVLLWYEALPLLVLCWIAGGAMLVGASRSAAEAQRVRDAPTCLPEQRYTPTPCRFTVDAVVIRLAGPTLDLEVEGRGLNIQLYMNTKGWPQFEGGQAQVVYYRGVPVRVEGAIDADVEDSPAAEAEQYQNIGPFVLIGGTIALGLCMLVEPSPRPFRFPPPTRRPPRT